MWRSVSGGVRVEECMWRSVCKRERVNFYLYSS